MKQQQHNDDSMFCTEQKLPLHQNMHPKVRHSSHGSVSALHVIMKAMSFRQNIKANSTRTPTTPKSRRRCSKTTRWFRSTSYNAMSLRIVFLLCCTLALDPWRCDAAVGFAYLARARARGNPAVIHFEIQDPTTIFSSFARWCFNTHPPTNILWSLSASQAATSITVPTELVHFIICQ